MANFTHVCKDLDFRGWPVAMVHHDDPVYIVRSCLRLYDDLVRKRIPNALLYRGRSFCDIRSRAHNTDICLMKT